MKRDEINASGTRVVKRSATASVWFALADTTWRVAVPTVLFAMGGLLLDKALHTLPLCTLVGLVLGLTAAGVLVWQQLKIVETTGEEDV